MKNPLAAAASCLALILASTACGDEPAPSRVSAKRSAIQKKEGPPAVAKATPPIILMSIDTLRADHLGCYGYQRDTSPHIDEFAQQAVLFERAISQAAVTAPAHMSLFTGLTPAVHGVFNHSASGAANSTLSPTISTLAELLTAQGYLSVSYNGGGNVDADLGFGRGFESYTHDEVHWPRLRDSEGELDPIRETIRRSVREQRPLFLFLHHFVCHDPYLTAPDIDRLRYLDDPVEGLPVSRGDLADRDEDTNPRVRFWRDIHLDNPRHLDHVVSLYDGNIHYSDFAFGEVAAILHEEGIWDDAFVILLGDHGEEFFEHGAKLHWRLFVETLHVPLLIKYPGGAHAGTRVSQVVRSFDLMPTLLEAMGLDLPAGMQATSLSPLLGSPQDYDPLIMSFANQKPGGAIRFQDEHFIYSDQRSNRCDEWVFDPIGDPAEQHNLAAERPDVVRALRGRAAKLKSADEWLAEQLGSGAGELAEPDEEVMAELRALGYVK